MMSMPWMKCWVADFLLSTDHLPPEQVGWKIRLLCICWYSNTCSIPSDPAWIKQRLHINDEEYERAVKPVIDEFWTEEKGRLFNKEQRDEFSGAVAACEKLALSGSRRIQTRWAAKAEKDMGYDDLGEPNSGENIEFRPKSQAIDK